MRKVRLQNCLRNKKSIKIIAAKLVLDYEKKRDLFAELKQGINDINSYKQNKITLRTYKHDKKPSLSVDSDFVRKMREKLNMSRSVFALKLRVSPRTLEKWEQGKSIPNDQASILLLLVSQYPDTLKRLDNLRIK